MSKMRFSEKVGKFLYKAFVGSVMTVLLLLAGYVVVSMANHATLQPKHISRVYSTREVSVANGYKLEVGGDRYFINAHDELLFWNCSKKPEKFFQVSTWKGCFGLESFKVEEIAKNEVRQLVTE